MVAGGNKIATYSQEQETADILRVSHGVRSKCSITTRSVLTKFNLGCHHLAIQFVKCCVWVSLTDSCFSLPVLFRLPTVLSQELV